MIKIIKKELFIAAILLIYVNNMKELSLDDIRGIYLRVLK